MRTKFQAIFCPIILLPLLLSLIGFLLLPQQLLADSPYDWKLVRDEDGIQVYLKEIWADDIKSFKGIIHIHSSVDSLLALILDINACSDWVHRCKNPLLLFKKSFAENYHYQIYQLPFPARDREFIFHSKVSRSTQNGNVTIKLKAIPNFCQNEIKACALIRDTTNIKVKHSHGHYLLEPIKNGITRVTWIQHTNPEGLLPAWLVNQLVQAMPYQTLQGLRKKVLNHKYQKAKLVVNRHGAITDLVVVD